MKMIDDGRVNPVLLELYAGTRSIGRAFDRAGFDTYSVDWDKKFPDITYYGDIGKLTADDCIGICGGRRPDVIWASPDCTSYSIAGIGHNRKKNPTTGELESQTEYGKQSDFNTSHVIDLFDELKPTYWFMENPRGGMRTMQYTNGMPRYTISYCQYGDTRMKPTDIWTNHPNPRFYQPCKNGDMCHDRAPRGSRGGTQGIKGPMDRSRIPDAFCDHVAWVCNHPDDYSVAPSARAAQDDLIRRGAMTTPKEFSNPAFLREFKFNNPSKNQSSLEEYFN